MISSSSSRWLHALGGLLFWLGGASWAPSVAAAIDPANPYAWSENAGWLNFSPSGGGVAVYSDHLEGYAWSEGIGWIKLGSYGGGGSHLYANSSASDWGVNVDAAGLLSGYAWSESAGWINFNPSHGQVSINIATGDFDGYAWSEAVGWIHFRNPAPAYRVRALRRGTLQLSAATYSAAEAAGGVTITVSREGGSDGSASVQYATSDGSAVAGSDYTSASGVLHWLDGDGSDKQFSVAVRDEFAIEEDETFNVVLSGASGSALGSRGSAVATILNDDTPAPEEPAPVVEPTVPEGETVTGGQVDGSVENGGTLIDPTINDGGVVTGGTLGGNVVNNGVVSDVTLGGETTLQGGTVSGSIEGDPEAPATLQDVVIEDGATLSNVTLGGDSRLTSDVTLGEGVRFEDNALIPEEIDLSTALGSVGDGGGDEPPAVDLSGDVVAGGTPLIEAVNELPTFADSGLSTEQDSQSGALQLDIGEEHFALQPTQVTQAPAGTPPGVAITSDGLIEMVTESGRRIVSQPTLQSPEALAAALEAAGYVLTRATNGNLMISPPTTAARSVSGVPDDRYFSARPALHSTPAEAGAALGVVPCELPERPGIEGFCQVFDRDGERRIQRLWPAPADWEALKGYLMSLPVFGDVRMDAEGLIHFTYQGVGYQGYVGYEVDPGIGSGYLNWEQLDPGADEGDDDARVSLRLIYPNGDRQRLYLNY